MALPPNFGVMLGQTLATEKHGHGATRRLLALPGVKPKRFPGPVRMSGVRSEARISDGMSEVGAIPDLPTPQTER